MSDLPQDKTNIQSPPTLTAGVSQSNGVSAGPTYYFTPQHDAKTPLLNALASAQRKIRVADYSYNDPDITDILVQKFQSGVDVVMILDSSQSKGKTEVPLVERLKAAGIPLAIGTSPEHKIVHDKKALIDDTLVAWGSYNFTTAAEKEVNTLEIVNNPDICKAFQDVWQNDYDFIVAHEPNGLFNIKE